MSSSPPPRFAWDGPESVAGTTDVRPGLYPSTLSLVLPQEWTSTTHGFHAISTVLNSPHKRQPPPKPHSHLPPAVPAVLPRVRRADFDPYLRAIGHEWARFQLSASQGHAGVLQLPDSAPAAPPDPKAVPPLDSVPPVFFAPAFSLADPRTFAAVTPDADPTALADALPLLEKLSHYADTVEQHLVLEISHRAPSFFAALTNLHDLHAESEHCLQRIASLRALLTDLDNNSAKRGLDLVRRQARAADIAVLSTALKQVASVVEMGRVARALVSAGQWGHALGVIDELDAMWHQHTDDPPMPTISEEDPPAKLPLSSLRAYAALPQHLRALTMEIAASLSSEFVSLLRDDLKDHDPDLRDRLRPLIQGLVRTRGVKEGLLSWREVVLAVVRQIVRSRLPKEEEGEQARAFNRAHFRDMRHPEFILLLQNLYADLLRCIEGIQSQSNVIVSILETTPLQTPPALTPPQAQDELADILASAAELANTDSASLIAFRHDAHAALDLAAFLAFFNDAWAFVVRCEVLSRRMIVALRGVVVGQAKAFLQAFHQRRIAREAKLVEDEQWTPAEISPRLQGIADAIVRSAVEDAPELVVVNVGGEPAPASAPQQHANGAGAKQLRIEDRAYFAVGATTEVLVLLLEYLRVVVNLSTLTTDAMSRVVEFLKAFNSRTCQVVLGAGAMRSAGLKNITAKHLALASQSLSIVFELIPYVRETFRRHLSPTQAVMLVEFDKLKRDYQEHQNEIHAKLIAIMGDRLCAHVKSLQAVDWTVPKPGGGVNDYIEILVKETVTLHKVLSRYLAVPVVEYVMTQVFAAINHGLSEEYNKIELPNQEAKTRLLADAKYLHQKLSALKNVAPPSGMLVTVVSEKSVPRPAPASPPGPPPTRAGTLSSANQRLKGLLSGRAAAPSLQTPVRSSLAPAPTAPALASSPPLDGASSSSPPPPPQARKVSAGFKQVEAQAQMQKQAEGEEGSDAGPGPVCEDDARPEKAGMSLEGATRDVRGQRRTVSTDVLQVRPRDVLAPGPGPGPGGPEPDAEPEPEVRVPWAEGALGLGVGSGETAGTGGVGGGEAQVRGLGVSGGEGEGEGQLDAAAPGLEVSLSLCSEYPETSLQLPPRPDRAPPPADGARS